ncbi:hypothetical protein, partial [uncultured Bifidobacterium sp.]|uniref:hypothetical protein n=1 Tax=uncultured Bifidobacterium sp. TaxID=165187 RepID=UPI0026368850
MYGMVMTPISILDAVSIVFIMALNPTEWTNRAAIFEGFRSAQCLGMAMLECDKRHAVQGWRNTQQEHLRAFDFGDFRQTHDSGQRTTGEPNGAPFKIPPSSALPLQNDVV